MKRTGQGTLSNTRSAIFSPAWRGLPSRRCVVSASSGVFGAFRAIERNKNMLKHRTGPFLQLSSLPGQGIFDTFSSASASLALGGGTTKSGRPLGELARARRAARGSARSALKEPSSGTRIRWNIHFPLSFWLETCFCPFSAAEAILNARRWSVVAHTLVFPQRRRRSPGARASIQMSERQSLHGRSAGAGSPGLMAYCPMSPLSAASGDVRGSQTRK